jgi:hypothetical protein
LLYLWVRQVERHAERLGRQTLDPSNHGVEVGNRVAANLNPGRGVQYTEPASVGNGGHQFGVGHPGQSRLEDRVAYS